MKNKLLLFGYVFAASFGAFVVGLNLGGISGALEFITAEFGLSAMAMGLVTSAIMIGCLIGALLGSLGRNTYLYIRNIPGQMARNVRLVLPVIHRYRDSCCLLCRLRDDFVGKQLALDARIAVVVCCGQSADAVVSARKSALVD